MPRPRFFSRRHVFRSNLRRHRRSTQPVAAVESLEDRVLLSNVALIQGTLVVDGSNGDDMLLIQQSQDNTRILVRVYDAGGLAASGNFSAGQVNIVAVRGHGGNDLAIHTTAIADVLLGGAGRDRLVAGNGASALNGGTGNDVLYGRDGNDLLVGGIGNDVLYGGNGHDRLAADEGFDIIQGQTGNDRMAGGGQNDRIWGSDGFDVIDGGLAADLLHGGALNDRVSGNEGADQINGEGDGDILTGGVGDDVIDGGEGTDTLSETGDVSYFLTDTTLETYEEYTFNPFPAFEGLINTDALAGIEAAVLIGGEGDNGISTADPAQQVVLFSGSVTFRGVAGNDILIGGNEDDFLSGGEGDDLLLGGDGADDMEGGAGTDTFNFFGETSILGEGDDNIDGGLFSEDQTAGDGLDVIFAGAGNDRVDGDNGSDTIDGGEGTEDIARSPSGDGVNDDDIFGNDVDDDGDGAFETVQTEAFTDFPWTA